MSETTFLFLGLLFTVGNLYLTSFYNYRKDKKIQELMKKGLGPDRYVTYEGRTIVNINRRIKEKFMGRLV